MKKGSAIGIGVAVIVLAIIVGIASIPDEVLHENPTLETSENQIIITETPEEPAIEETPEEPAIEETPEEPAIEETIEEAEEESSEGNTIQVEIRDGVGSGDR